MATKTLPEVPTLPIERVAGRSPLSRRLHNAPYYGVLVLWSALTILIFVWVVLSSFKSNVEVFGSPWSLPAAPIDSISHNYGTAWSTSHLGLYFTNSVIVSIASVVLVVFISAPAAYALSRIDFPGKGVVTYYFLAGLGLPLQLVLIPLYVLLNQLHILDTLQGLIMAYIGVSIPFTILLLTGFFRTLPTELEEAGAIDGASEFKIFWRIMMPLAGPGMFTAGIFNFVSIWNEFLLALLIVNSDHHRTVPIGVLNIRYSMQYTSDWSALFAAVVIVIIPTFIVYLILSERIMAGLTLGSGK
jgi:N-acetylglucosamine transport system permease protein